MKVLNLYAGIGGNRKLWDDVDVTAVEWDEDIARVYKDTFPNDKVVVGDAHEHLLNNYEDYDFIWSSPPCQTHSKMNRTIVGRGQRRPLYPDMKLWQEIIFLQNWAEGKWVVENVIPMYEPLIKPSQNIERHYFWSNFRIGYFNLGDRHRPSVDHDKTDVFLNEFGLSLDGYTFKNARKDQVARNCVHPEVGKYILDRARDIIIKSDTEQTKLPL